MSGNNKKAVWKLGDHINTDLIYPSRYLYESQAPEVLASHVMEPLIPDYRNAIETGDYLVAGENFGCGSSREQAVTALKFAGCGGIIAKSFSRIFYRNCIALGLASIVCPEAVDALETGDKIQVDLKAGKIIHADKTYHFAMFGDYVGGIIESGGLIPFLKKRVTDLI